MAKSLVRKWWPWLALLLAVAGIIFGLHYLVQPRGPWVLDFTADVVATGEDGVVFENLDLLYDEYEGIWGAIEPHKVGESYVFDFGDWNSRFEAPCRYFVSAYYWTKTDRVELRLVDRWSQSGGE